MVLGQQQVQGLDYAYTVHGWLKGVNGTNLTPASDMGHDGANGGITARDAFGFALHYFGERDYKPVGTGLHPFADAESAGSTFKPLFNGNISMMSVNLPKVGEPLLYSYSYDVLNRLVKMDAARNLNTTTNNWEPVVLPDYHERVSYDPNGNILTYNRNGNPTGTSKPERMDSLTYNYIAGTNKLDNIQDQVAAAAYENDIDAQPLKNYEYDEIGNLTKDSLAGIYKNGIEWTVYGKIKKILKHTPEGDVTITYNYDPSGNRISKNVNNKVTRYVRDASGNVMSVYVYDDPAVNNGKLSQTEVHLYGSSRLGISTRVTEVENSLALDWASSGGQDSVLNITFARGKKFFELPNHLGNVMATVSDVKRARSGNGSTIDYYEADLVSAQDYYPFGMVQPGRSLNIGNYRYGFNGKENDNEVKGEGNQTAFETRVFDPRSGRFLSIDPLTGSYPNNSPYMFGGDNPVRYVDVLGMWPDWPDHAPRNLWEHMLYGFYKAGKFVQEGRLTAWTPTGRRNQEALTNAVMSSSLGVGNGVGSQLTFGIYRRSAEDIGINEGSRKWYDVGTLVGQSTPILGSESGPGVSPSLALAQGSVQSVVNKAVVSLTIQTATILLASPNNKNQSSEAPQEREIDGPIYRGGNSMEMSNADVNASVDKQTGLMKERGISTNMDKWNKYIQNYGGAFEIDVSTVPKELKFRNHPAGGTHFEITPLKPGTMTLERYQELVRQIVLKPMNQIKLK